MFVIYLAADSHGISSLTFFEKHYTYLKLSPAAVVIGDLSFNIVLLFVRKDLF